MTLIIKKFTMVELLLVLAILATLSAVVLPKFSGRSQQSKVTATQTQIHSIEGALDAYEIDNGAYPKTSEGLSVLTEAPSKSDNWKGPYLKKTINNDPWGNAYVYQYPGKNNSYGYDLMSMGPDGKSGSDDDITNWDID